MIDPKGLVPMTIAVFLEASPWGNIDDQAMGKGLGGRETALVHLAMEWAKLGHDVYAFVPRDSMEILEHESGGKVRWIPNNLTVEITHAVQPDLFISWENADVLAMLTDYNGITAIEMQVAHLSAGVEVAEVADYICVLSPWAGEFIRTQHEIEEHRVVVFRNGVDLERFEGLTVRAPEFDPMPGSNNPYHFIYSSSPDRGLHHLLRMWHKIREMVQSEFGSPCELHVCYGVESFIDNSRWSHREDGIRALEIEDLLDQEGIHYHGKIGQGDLAQLMVHCDLMLYPADTISPTETGCISIVEALAAGTPVVTTDCDCIGPDYKDVTKQVPLPLLPQKLMEHDPDPYNVDAPIRKFIGSGYDDYIKAILDALEPEDYQATVEAGLEFVPERGWDYIANEWIKFFREKVARADYDIDMTPRSEGHKALDDYYEQQIEEES